MNAARDPLEVFLEELANTIKFKCESSEELSPSPEKEFTTFMLELLLEAGEIEEYNLCDFRRQRMKVDAYALPEKEDYLDLFVTIYLEQEQPTSLPPEKIRTAFRQVTTFFEECEQQYYKRLQESSPVYPVAQAIYEAKRRITRVRFFCLTNGVSSMEKNEEKKGNRTYTYHLWDLQRTQRSVMSDQRQEPIQVDFMTEYGITLPCIPITDTGPDYDVCLTVIPGEIIYNLYREYGARLLERNVRSYLQARGKVNKGIHQTIKDCPERFLAYNNGISATADHVEYQELSDRPGAEWRIRKVTNLQIVNGGQTTASIYQAYKKDPDKVSKIYVPAKLSIVKPELLDQIVPLISRYSNSQNKVSDADFYANDSFHVSMHKVSQQVWTPGTKQTKWYYERARGSYLQEKSRRKKEFEKEYPKEQVFDKTELAKYLMAWERSPNVVSLGSEKCFREFTKRLIDSPRAVDETFFKDTVARAILFRNATKIIKQQKFGGYENHIVAYTVAYLCEAASKKDGEIDLKKIWRDQNFSKSTEEAVIAVSRAIQALIAEVPAGMNVYEWFKKLSTWDAVRQREIDIPQSFFDELVAPQI